jgi:ketosteroid isomerase-like protein
MSADTSKAQAEVSKLIDDWAKTLRAKHVESAMSHYAPDILTFDLAPPLQYVGANAIRKSLADWFPTFVGPLGYETRGLNIAASGDVAFSTSLNRITGTRTSGEETDVWVRMTLGCKRINGTWMIAHEHASVPFHMDGSYKAAVDLKP